MSPERAEPNFAPREHEAFIGIGSNLAHPATQIEVALREIALLPGTRILACSSRYRSVPLGVARRQPKYLNAVVQISTRLAPLHLLKSLQSIERAQRRRRATPNAPRSLDLDLLTYAARTERGRRLRLPHPRMHERAFVLKPLLEIAPHARIPGLGRAARLLPRTRGQRIARIP